MKQTRFIIIISMLLVSSVLNAQTNAVKNYFREEVADQSGTITVRTEKGETKVIDCIMAYGKDAKVLSVKLNDGFAYKLAPGKDGSNLNYIGSSLGLVIKDGDVMKIEVIGDPKQKTERHLYVAGFTYKQ